MMQRLLRVFGAILLGSTITVPSAFAQLSTAQLDGRVTDTSDAVLPGATVTVTQTETGTTRSVVTDGDGAYLLTKPA